MAPEYDSLTLDYIYDGACSASATTCFAILNISVIYAHGPAIDVEHQYIIFKYMQYPSTNDIIIVLRIVEYVAPTLVFLLVQHCT
jgi:hypothetical protein